MKHKTSVKFLSLIAILIVVLSASACAPVQQQQPAAAAKGAADYKIVLLLPGPINDQSWNATNYAGLVKANETLGTKIEYVENVQAADFESTFRNYAERGYDLIMAAGTQFDEAANKVAARTIPTPSSRSSTACWPTAPTWRRSSPRNTKPPTSPP